MKEIGTVDLIFSEKPPEINEYMILFNTTGWYKDNPVSSAEMCKVLNNSYYMVSAYKGDKLVGFGRIDSDGFIHAMIYEMIVDPGFQGMGIGRRILQMLVDKCLAAGIRDIQLFCAKGKLEFYTKCGFELRPENAPGMQFTGREMKIVKSEKLKVKN
jgi:GNAT superfamily N-acetyltransferase